MLSFVMYAELKCLCVMVRRDYKVCHISNDYDADKGLSFVMYTEL